MALETKPLPNTVFDNSGLVVLVDHCLGQRAGQETLQIVSL